MEKIMCAGIIMSREEGKEALRMISQAHDQGYIDAPTYAAMAVDVLIRTVPEAS